MNKYAKENTLDAAISMSEILRRICIKKYPYAVSLNGKEWSDFLCSKSKHPLGKSAAFLLQTAPYRKEDDSISVQDIEELRRFCFNWVGENL